MRACPLCYLSIKTQMAVYATTIPVNFPERGPVPFPLLYALCSPNRQFSVGSPGPLLWLHTENCVFQQSVVTISTFPRCLHIIFLQTIQLWGVWICVVFSGDNHRLHLHLAKSKHVEIRHHLWTPQSQRNLQAVQALGLLLGKTCTAKQEDVLVIM